MKNFDSKVANGDLLRLMIISGANNLFNHYPEVDALNVFPVPDGDTGTNMNLTITSGSKEIMNIRNDNIYEVSKAFSKGLLMGARGNSGVILSQIFRGFSQGLAGKSEVNVVELAEAWKKGASVAYRAVVKPVEGTILTVIRESAEALSSNVDTIPTIGKAMEVFLEAAQVSLEHTPELLPVLKEVGVVDSGGAGLVRIIEGMLAGLKGELIERKQVTIAHTAEEISVAKEIPTSTAEYFYSIDFTLKLDPGKKKFDPLRFRKVLEGIGEALNINQKDDELEVHVNAKKPGVTLNLAQTYGEFTLIRVENIKEGVKVEEVVKEPEENKEWAEYAIIATAVGEGLKALFKNLHVNYIVSGGQTMNPSTEDFVEAIKKVHAKRVFLLPNNKNVIMAVEQARDLAEDCECRVIPSKTITQGIIACMVFNPEVDFSANEEAMREAITTIKSGQVTFSIKDTRIDGVNIKKDEFMGIYEGHIVNCNKNKNTSVKELLKKMIDEDSSIVTLIYGEGVSEEEAKAVASFINEKYSIEVEIHNGGQPVYAYFVGVE